MSKRNRKWKRTGDDLVRQRWDLTCKCKDVERSAYVDPSFYGENGVPICQDCGADREYVSTEMRVTGQKTITITMEGGVIQDIQHIPKSVRVRVLDFDTEGTTEDELTSLRNGQQSVVSVWG